VAPTKAGKMLLSQAELMSNQSKLAFEMIQELKDKDDAIEAMPTDQGGLVVSIANELSDLLVGAAFAGLNNRISGPVSLDVNSGARIEEQVLSGAADIGVVCDVSTRPELTAAKLAEDDMVLVFGPALLESSRAITPLMHALGGLPMLLPTWEHSSRRLVEQNAMRAGVRLRVHAEIADFSALKMLLRQGLGYAILPHCTVREEAARGMLCTIAMRGNGSRVGLSMICRRTAKDRPNIVAAKRELANCLSQVVDLSPSTSMRLATHRDSVVEAAA
jgi:LysR family nitrogen assimilation transcriptional regulator